MRLWRISNYATLSGTGGLISSGRWHSRGSELVYLADSPASALLERLVHLELSPDEVPETYQLLAVEVSDFLAFDTVDQATLPTDWRSNDRATWPIGDGWLQQRRTPMLRVPSAIVPYTWNWLLNPRHREAATVKIVEVIDAPFDRRLFHLLRTE